MRTKQLVLLALATSLSGGCKQTSGASSTFRHSGTPSLSPECQKTAQASDAGTKNARSLSSDPERRSSTQESRRHLRTAIQSCLERNAKWLKARELTKIAAVTLRRAGTESAPVVSLSALDGLRHLIEIAEGPLNECVADAYIRLPKEGRAAFWLSPQGGGERAEKVVVGLGEAPDGPEE
jgi:hypothetical protein